MIPMRHEPSLHVVKPAGSIYNCSGSAYPSASLATRSPDGNEEQLFRRVDGRNCAGHQYSEDDQNAALNEAVAQIIGGTTVRSREGNRYLYRFLNRNSNGDPVVSLPETGFCVEPDATNYEWPILRSGNVFGSQGNKRAGDDRIIVAAYDPPGDATMVWSYYAMITHEGAARPGGFTNYT